MDHDTLGSKCFQKGDHLGALEHFDKAIKSSSPKLVPAILNKRSLVYIKLEKFQHALRDGREIIKRLPDMAMGYLRCGQVVQLMGQRDKALEILERGLHKVPVGNEDRKILSKHYEALRKQSQAANRLDPLPRLPQEIVLQIWGFLDLKSRGCCLSVSKGWKKSMESYPPLWQDLKIFNNKMSETALTAWLKRAEHSGYNLRSAIITSHDYRDKCRNYIKRIQCRNKLERLQLNIVSQAANIPAMLPVPSHYLKTLVLSSGSWVDISDVKRIMAHYTHLEHVEFHAVYERDSPCSWPEMPNLQFIVLQSSVAHKSMRYGTAGRLGLAYNDLVMASPNMKSASIKGWAYEATPYVTDMSSWTKLTHLDILGTRFDSMPVLPSSLTHLEAADVGIISHRFDTDEKFVFPFSKLEYLSVEGGDLFAIVNDMANPGLTSGSLKTLKVGHIGPTHTDTHNDWIKMLPAPSAALETLSLCERIGLPEKTIIAVLRQFPNLKEVDLSRTEATGSTLRELFERENKPKLVNMKNCTNCYHDAVEAARRVGIEVWHELAPKNNKTDSKFRDQYYN
ncbi:hypothetical protein VE01_01171 [Pseudogymnoascus verrucosus]|uniref:F-box domain-containing protein n=1 Tax=Pseudogymnoascus verrucosus TaxID=342668 RepID=A0A1B8GY55_9PEZI|nr:uncharacterized protein VE01_01171 [Pseudogymnoascus verrucosus]OBU00756.1 hypothetical protein VE01_01171 [Pseudogymnoascus verrucosus]